MSEEIVKQENPWDVSNIQEFLYYNCPECETRMKDSQLFIQHALDNHELSKAYLNKTVVEMVSQYQDDSISDHEIEEIKERKPTQEELALSDKNFMGLKLHKLKVEPDVVLKVPDLKIRIQDPEQDYQPEVGSDSDSDIALPAEDEDDVKPDEPFFCDMCDKFYTEKYRLKEHIKLNHGKRCDRRVNTIILESNDKFIEATNDELQNQDPLELKSQDVVNVSVTTNPKMNPFVLLKRCDA